MSKELLNVDWYYNKVKVQQNRYTVTFESNKFTVAIKDRWTIFLQREVQNIQLKERVNYDIVEKDIDAQEKQLEK